MKKFYLFLIIIMVCLASACGRQDKSGPAGPSYSNLADQESMDLLLELLEGKSLDKSRLDYLLATISKYNEDIAYSSLNTEGLKTLGPGEGSLAQLDYDLASIDQLWQEKNGLFIGNNCRMTSLDILYDFIDYGENLNLDSSNLFMDLDAISYDETRELDSPWTKKFLALYSQVKTEKNLDQDFQIRKFEEALDQRAIAYKTPKGLSQISLVLNSSLDDILFIGHSGVLIEGQDQVYFVEKLSFQEPYQLLAFKSRLELNQYLMEKYGNYYDEASEARPFIFENNRPMKGFKNLDQ